MSRLIGELEELIRLASQDVQQMCDLIPQLNLVS